MKTICFLWKMLFCRKSLPDHFSVLSEKLCFFAGGIFTDLTIKTGVTWAPFLSDALDLNAS